LKKEIIKELLGKNPNEFLTKKDKNKIISREQALEKLNNDPDAWIIAQCTYCHSFSGFTNTKQNQDFFRKLKLNKNKGYFITCERCCYCHFTVVGTEKKFEYKEEQ